MIKTIVTPAKAGIQPCRQNPRDKAKSHSRLKKAFRELRQSQALPSLSDAILKDLTPCAKEWLKT